jgi:diguanylate cyclase (GGDEF)-like protein
VPPGAGDVYPQERAAARHRLDGEVTALPTPGDGPGSPVATTAPVRPSWEALRAYSQLLRRILDGLPFAVAVFDADRLTLHNEELAQLLPEPPAPGTADLRGLIEGLRPIVTDPEMLEARLRDALRDPQGAAEFEVALRDGGALAISATELAAGEAIAVCLRDATGELHARRELEHRAMHDPLTGLPNRELLMDRLSVALARLGRQGTGLGVLFIDLDGFKQINDEHGHAVGDELLVSIASRLQREVRDGDTVARYGGDEFVVLCEDIVHLEAALPLARRLAGAIGQPVSAGDRMLAVQASVGVVVEQNPAATAEALVTRADAEMYRVKQRER